MDNKRAATAFYSLREQWVSQVFADRRMSMRGKLVAAVLASHFNRAHCDKTRVLRAWPSVRTLDRETGMSRNTVYAALKDVAERGYINVQRRFDPQKRQWRNNVYDAVVRPRATIRRDPHPIMNQGLADANAAQV